MNNEKNESSKAAMRRASNLIREADRALREAADKADDSSEGSTLAWVAGCAKERLDTIEGDVRAAIDGREVPWRVELVAVGTNEHGSGGFGRRALQALALCREAWVNADQNNAPRMERAMGWIARAWLGTAGYERAHVVRAVLTQRMDPGVQVRIVARVNASMAHDSEAATLAQDASQRGLLGPLDGSAA